MLAISLPSASTMKQISSRKRAAKSFSVSLSTPDGGSIASAPKIACVKAWISPAHKTSVQRRTGNTSVKSAAKRRDDRGERGLGLRSVRPARLRHVGTAAAAFPAERRCCRLHQVDSIEAGGQIVGHTHHDAGLAFAGDADQRHNAGAELLLTLVGEAFQ